MFSVAFFTFFTNSPAKVILFSHICKKISVFSEIFGNLDRFYSPNRKIFTSNHKNSRHSLRNDGYL